MENKKSIVEALKEITKEDLSIKLSKKELRLLKKEIENEKKAMNNDFVIHCLPKNERKK